MPKLVFLGYPFPRGIDALQTIYGNGTVPGHDPRDFVGGFIAVANVGPKDNNIAYMKFMCGHFSPACGSGACNAPTAAQMDEFISQRMPDDHLRTEETWQVFLLRHRGGAWAWEPEGALRAGPAFWPVYELA